mmetsp:Transcript_88777/g.250065  ORF Transcript_88777/g.250065 Transcript_88777/m.250065 type:complete len:232 (+) Transcript_88777:107-802(+)
MPEAPSPFCTPASKARQAPYAAQGFDFGGMDPWLLEPCAKRANIEGGYTADGFDAWSSSVMETPTKRPRLGRGLAQWGWERQTQGDKSPWAVPFGDIFQHQLLWEDQDYKRRRVDTHVEEHDVEQTFSGGSEAEELLLTSRSPMVFRPGDFARLLGVEGGRAPTHDVGEVVFASSAERTLARLSRRDLALQCSPAIFDCICTAFSVPSPAPYLRSVLISAEVYRAGRCSGS